jgi:hypothetical protein
MGKSMPNDKNTPSSQKCGADRWARALGLSTQRLLALVQDVVEERQNPGAPSSITGKRSAPRLVSTR